MPPTKQTYAISLVSHTPDHGDGSIRQGDEVTFAGTPTTGPITVSGIRDGEVLVRYFVPRLNPTVTLTASPAWSDSPGPLHAHVVMETVVHHKLIVVAEMEFEITG